MVLDSCIYMQDKEERYMTYEVSSQTDDKQYMNNYRPAGFWMRFWAYVSDVVIVFSINGLVLSILNTFNAYDITLSIWTLSGIVSSLMFYIYFLLMTKFFNQTLGKMIFGLKVVPDNNQQLLTWTDLLFREVIGRFIYKSFFMLNLLYVVVAFNREKQGIHDIFGQTRVVHTS